MEQSAATDYPSAPHAPRREVADQPVGAGATIQVLLVEDNLGDARLTQEAFRDLNRPARLHIVRDGMEAMAFLRKQPPYANAPRPDIILLDLDLPKLSGPEVLAQIKADETLKMIPTIILSMSDAPKDIAKSYRLQASCYLSKPLELSAFESVVTSLNNFWLAHAILPPRSKRAES